MNLKNIRNFSIIAHIDHGKSTLADRFLEVTNTIEKRKMQEQVLDSMELERERGITIKMQPVRMEYTWKGEKYILNLIDTPGHIDFYYEVSRALRAVEGSILLVDATQGVQAQTLTTLAMAQEAGLTIIPVISKVDSPLARVADTKTEISKLIGCDESEILECSGKTGQGVPELLGAIIEKIPAPKESFAEIKSEHLRALVFDFQYSNHRGVIVYVRVTEGRVEKNDQLFFSAAGEKFIALETGIFHPAETPTDSLGAGEIGYIVTGIKQPGIASVGDTITTFRNPLPPLHGYESPIPVVWASVYPEDQEDFNLLRQGLERLRLSDSAFTFEEESSGTLGRGMRCGFLGMLHLEIITERLRREFNLNLIVTTPSITYEVTDKKGAKKIVYSPPLFPDFGDVSKVREPWVNLNIICPAQFVGQLMTLLYDHEGTIMSTETFGDGRNSIHIEMPLRELMRNFFDEVKSVTSGYASMSYKIGEFRDADVLRLDFLVADELVPAFTRIVATRRVTDEAEKGVDKLHEALPKQLFVTKIQGKAMGRIISSRTLSALKRDVAAHLSGGDRSRKMKLWKQQKEGKKRMKEHANVHIPQDVFVKMMKSGE